MATSIATHCWKIALVLLLVVIRFPALASECSWGVRNAYAAGEKPFLEHLQGGIVTVNNPGRAGICDVLLVEVVNYDQWRTNQDGKARSGDLVLFLDRVPIPGLHLQRYPERDWIDVIAGETNTFPKTNFISYFGVKLEQNATNHSIWKQVLHSPNFDLVRPIEVSLGFMGGEQMNTWVYPTALAQGKSPFYLVILKQQDFYLGFVVIILAFIAFLWLVKRTDLLRDPNLPLRPDGRLPLSLARTQMAFWFFLVFASFFLLWLATGYTDTLNASTITLIGISAGTAVTSAFIDTGKWRSLRDNVVVVDDAPDINDVIKRLIDERQKVKQALIDSQHAREHIPPINSAALDLNDEQQKLLDEKRKKLDGQIDFFQLPPWRAGLNDLLGENGIISFHRFQMCVWTVVLGIIFIKEVYSKCAMPEFDATLLGLMGVSAGTFIGFKMPMQAGR